MPEMVPHGMGAVQPRWSGCPFLSCRIHPNPTHQQNNMIIGLLFAAAIVEGALESWAEFGLILGVIVINTALGASHQDRGERVGWGSVRYALGCACPGVQDW